MLSSLFKNNLKSFVQPTDKSLVESRIKIKLEGINNMEKLRGVLSAPLRRHLKSDNPETRALALQKAMAKAPKDMVLCETILRGDFTLSTKRELIGKIAGAFSAPIWFDSSAEFSNLRYEAVQAVINKMTNETPPFFRMLAKQNAETVREIHGLWTEIKPQELPRKVEPEVDSSDTRSPKHCETAARRPIADRLSAVYNRFEAHTTILGFKEGSFNVNDGHDIVWEYWNQQIHLLAYEIDGLLFVL